MKKFKKKLVEIILLSEPNIYRLIIKNNFPKQLVNFPVRICPFSFVWLIKIICVFLMYLIL